MSILTEDENFTHGLHFQVWIDLFTHCYSVADGVIKFVRFPEQGDYFSQDNKVMEIMKTIKEEFHNEVDRQRKAAERKRKAKGH